MTSETYTRHEAQELIEAVKASDDVIRLNRIGAVPYLWYNEYTNNRGVVVRNWDCISYQLEARAGRSLLTYPRVVRPWQSDDYAVQRFSDSWVVGELMKHHKERVEVIEFDDSPFAGGVITDWD